jgi:hypothetical protein
MRQLQPFVVLLLLPVMIGLASALWLRDARNASLVAALGSIVAIYTVLALLDPEGPWSGVAAFLVMPLPVASAVAAVLICYGRAHRRRSNRLF